MWLHFDRRFRPTGAPSSGPSLICTDAACCGSVARGENTDASQLPSPGCAGACASMTLGRGVGIKAAGVEGDGAVLIPARDAVGVGQIGHRVAEVRVSVEQPRR